ncbi:hypothetical protein F9802_15255 [Bacillus aerolatus]|uniref:Phosphotyrosine protein phosphatase I domain-containing protein n=1 Tax=Bacillus aerolatus TaxID=2653354 RepID=A0A6I1FH43_9BACI|nr:hypothetical protein [Bacillus aerolatus]KAB7704920.1 hypothetical protein F9802_15255 [Bacillus aerolatus]
MDNKNILLLSTSNDLSIMAEGWASRLNEPSLNFVSASFLKAQDDDLPIEAMKEVNIDITNKEPKLLAPHLIKSADLIVNIYDFQRDQHPDLPLTSNKKVLRWNITNPAHCKDALEKWAAYQIVCDELADHVRNLKEALK